MTELREIKRYITTHDETGRSVFAKSISDNPPPAAANTTPAKLFLCYATQNFPVDIQQEKDIERYKDLIVNPPPGIIIPGGSAARIIDFPPNYSSPMHRTVSVNYNFVIEGEIEIILDSEETRLMKQGDVLVQRTINHYWRARIAAVSFPVVADGIEESGLEDVFNSD